VYVQRQSPWKRASRSAEMYFVGRRPHEAAEVYLVKRHDVERLRSATTDAPVALDWQLGHEEVLALSHAVLSRAGGPDPSPALELRFAQLLMQFPEAGFVLRADTVAAWLASATQAPAAQQPRSWLTWLRATVRGRRRTRP
jgi:hypothetical protein